MPDVEKITSINGKLFYKIFLAGANKILENQSLLNQINVFPVPDADTGTNLASTFRAVIDNAMPNESFYKTADAIALAALNGARGNSGVIIAQFLYGVSVETSHKQQLTIEHFAEIILNAFKYVYDAISEPVEGTILTVIRDWAEFIHAGKEGFDDFIKMFNQAYDVAKASLEKTTEMLPSLKLANVVDAGGKGFVLFLEGVIEGLKKRKGKNEIILRKDIIPPDVFKTHVHDEFNYRYCTEGVIRGNALNKKEIKACLKKYGDSQVVAGSDNLLRIHIHTNTPHLLFDELRKFGTMSYQKADDMQKQNEIATKRKFRIALVTDSTSDIPDKLIEKYQISQVPLNIHFGENEYLDKITIQPDQFFTLIDKEKYFPTTSQPNEIKFLNLYSFLTTHYDSVIAVHLSEKFSGTFRNSLSAAQKIEKEKPFF